jgi:hypothetical protein
MSIPGAIGLAEELGALEVPGGVVMPGIGPIVCVGAGAVVMPGIGAIVCAASAGGTAAAATARAAAHPSAGRRIDKTDVPFGSMYYSL